MLEIVVNIPEDVEFISRLPKTELSLFVGRMLKEKLGRIERLKRSLQKSELTEEDAEALSNTINEGLAKKYIELYG
jgi:hypothetical protein